MSADLYAAEVIVTSYLAGTAGIFTPAPTPGAIDFIRAGLPDHRPNGMKGKMSALSGRTMSPLARRGTIGPTIPADCRYRPLLHPIGAMEHATPCGAMY